MRSPFAGAAIRRSLKRGYPRAFKVFADLRVSGDGFRRSYPKRENGSEAARGGIHKRIDTDHGQSGSLSGPVPILIARIVRRFVLAILSLT